MQIDRELLNDLTGLQEDLDARDGDGDGMVQDGTQWERPIDTQP